jgi:lipid-binding SYLF domain-containing protein
VSGNTFVIRRAILLALAMVFALGSALMAGAATTEELSTEARAVLDKLYSTNATAAVIGRSARAVLVFPRIIRTGLVARPYTEFSGGYGEGTLFKSGSAAGFYKFVSSTWKPQAEDASVSCIVFLMTDAVEGAVGAGNWAIGTGANIAVVDEGKMNNLATTALDRDAYVFVIGKEGLISAVSLQNAKVTSIKN